MIFNSPSNGGFQYNYNNSEMLRMYQSSGTNYIGNGTNNFILNTGKGSIISNSIHSSPNYYNTQSITYNMYTKNRTSGSYEIEVATYTVRAGNKVRLYYYSQYGNYFHVQADNASSLSVTLYIYSIYIRIYKNGTMISNSLFNSGGYTNTYSCPALNTINQTNWSIGQTAFVDDCVCASETLYSVRYYYTQTVTFTGGYYIDNSTAISILVNNSDSRFIKYESIPSSITGVTTCDMITCNLMLCKCGLACSSQGFNANTQTIPTQYLNFYYNSSKNALEIFLLSGTPSDIGGGVNNSFTQQRLGYIYYTVSAGSSSAVNIYSPIVNYISNNNDIITYNYLDCTYDMNVYGNLFVNGYIYSTAQTCFISDLNNTYLQSNEINSLTTSSQYNNLYSITSDNITVNSLNSNLFYSPRGQIDILLVEQ